MTKYLYHNTRLANYYKINVKTQVYSNLQYQLSDQFYNQVKTLVRSIVSDQVYAQLSHKIYEQALKQIRDQLNER